MGVHRTRVRKRRRTPVPASEARASLEITVVGGGILGLWQAYEFARRGQSVRVFEAMPEERTGGASRYAGAMLAPECESEASCAALRALGHLGLQQWRKAFADLAVNGTLVIASARDGVELTRFARMTLGHRSVNAADIARLEPSLTGRFAQGLFYPDEAHMPPRRALAELAAALRGMGAALHFEKAVAEPLWLAAAQGGLVVDCRGMAARHTLPNLRGVRGEMIVVHTEALSLQRPIRLLHPRHPLYVVPWDFGRYMIGATMIESDGAGPVTIRSALELLGSACALHPEFANARIEEMSACVRPAFPDNMPRMLLRGRRLIVNGAYRHGYLLAPILAEAAANAVLENRFDPTLIDKG